MSLAPRPLSTLSSRLRSFVTEISSLEEKADNQAKMLDHVLDLHNDLTDWCTSTEHSEAAQEVMTILEQYAHPAKSTLRSVG